jgi:Xaa-Pro aminopeptidase
MTYAGRIERAVERLGPAGLDALIVTDLVNVRYLTGYAGSNGVVVLASGGSTFLTDFRYSGEAERSMAGLLAVREVERDTIGSVGRWLPELAPGAARIGFEADQLPYAMHGRLAEAAAGLELVASTGLVTGLRAVKDEGEQEAVRASAALVAPVYETLAGEGLVGRREVDVAWRIRERFHELGAGDVSFPAIVASHERGALPHAEPTETEIGEGTLVTIDLGCMLNGYASDCTRTFATGEPPRELREAYAVCLEAQLLAMERIGPGMTGEEADAIARDAIEGAGYGGRFGHGLGHGVGLEIHEAPRLSPAAGATLEPGMVVTVEPGIYLPGVGGVRIEDLAIVTESGLERLTMYPKELTVVG